MFQLPSRRPLLLAGLLALPLALSAQTAEPPAEVDWRQANDAVGALKRGHADVLKWEQANTAAPPQATAATGLPLPTADAAVRLAWRAHPGLARVLARLGARNEQLIAAGDGLALDASLQRRVDDMGELLEVATQARKAWLEAVAAQQVAQQQAQGLEAAEAASELGQRMVAVGNWSRLQQAQVQLAATSARMNLQRARHAAALAQGRLIQALGQQGRVDAVALPGQLPGLPALARAENDLAQRAAALRQQLPDAERLRHPMLARTAIATYQAAHALAQDSQALLATRSFITDETVLHYNGMLKSVWDLLDAVGRQSAAAADAVGAQRDFWLAEADLMWVLLGGVPERFVPLGGASSEAASDAAH